MYDNKTHPSILPCPKFYTRNTPFPKKKVYVFVDLETTGLNLFANGIIQIGAIATGENEGEFLGYFVKDANPCKGTSSDGAFQRIEDSALKVNKFTHKRIEAAPYLADTLMQFENWLTDLAKFKIGEPEREIVIVCHGAKFDVPRIEFAFAQNNMEVPKVFRRVLCTVSLGYDVFGELLSLENLSLKLDITNGQSHDALADAIVTMKVFHALKRMKPNTTAWTPARQTLPNFLIQGPMDTKEFGAS